MRTRVVRGTTFKHAAGEFLKLKVSGFIYQIMESSELLCHLSRQVKRRKPRSWSVHQGSIIQFIVDDPAARVRFTNSFPRDTSASVGVPSEDLARVGRCAHRGTIPRAR